MMAELMRLVDFGKACGYVPTGEWEDTAKPLMRDEDFFHHIDQKLSGLEEQVIREVTIRGIKLALTGDVDFGDQTMMPVVFGGTFPLFKLTLVDEAQDLSALNHAMLRKICGSRRLISVGDQCQAIYGFRGAHEDGMAKLRQDFSMRELTLSTSFRCARSIVRAAQWRAPHMKAPEWAIEGEVRTATSWTAADVPTDAAIICRNNAPLFGIAIRLLRDGRTAELDGKDIVKSIVKTMLKFGSSDMPQHEVLDSIDAWCEKEKGKNKRRAHARIEDRAECMRTFARNEATLGDAIHYANHLGNLNSPLKLLTGHKSKGLEFHHVYFLDQHLISDEEQDPNVRYVIQTRAKETLTYVRSDGYHSLDMATVSDMATIP
jgi:superfamily I DNA/RNA helicase